VPLTQSELLRYIVATTSKEEEGRRGSRAAYSTVARAARTCALASSAAGAHATRALFFLGRPRFRRGLPLV
jgi:hypothetical protein